MSVKHTSSAPVISADETIEPSRLSGLQWRVIVLCAAIATLDGFDLQAISFVAPVLAEAWATPAAALGAVFSAGLFGVMTGQLLLAPLADRHGRKWVITVSTLSFGLFTLLSAWTWSVTSLAILRFMTGLGLGAAMPNIVALTSEYVPRRIRASAIMIMFCGVPLGGVVGGFLSARLIGALGWQYVFYVGGVLPLLLAIVLAWKLPESLHHRERSVTGSTIQQLFSTDQGGSTALLWVAYFMNQLIISFLVSWLPLVLKDMGLSLDAAILAVAILNGGGVVGAIALGRLIDSKGSFSVLGAAFLVGGLTAAAIGLLPTHPASLYLVICLAGVCIIGGQIGLSALAAAIYPTAIRSTGIGWALGIGRLGAIAGPMIGSLLLSAHTAFPIFFGFLLIPALVVTGSIEVLNRTARAPASERAPT